MAKQFLAIIVLIFCGQKVSLAIDTDDIMKMLIQEQAWGRNLSQYDKAGPYDQPYAALSGQEERKLLSVTGNIREFIWQHWKLQRRGYLRVTYYGVEGQAATHHIFVEPDEKGVWHLTQKVIAFDGRFDKSPRYYDEPIIYTVERIESRWVGYGIEPWIHGERLPPDKRHIIPANQKRDPLSYELRLKDEHRKVVGRF